VAKLRFWWNQAKMLFFKSPIFDITNTDWKHSVET